jgi:hypothetical protein
MPNYRAWYKLVNVQQLEKIRLRTPLAITTDATPPGDLLSAKCRFRRGNRNQYKAINANWQKKADKKCSARETEVTLFQTILKSVF